MELPETPEYINNLLKREFGCHVDGRPWFRVVFTEGLTEKRKMTHTDEGFQLLHPEVREVIKYNYIKEKYILERIVTILPGVPTDLVEKEPYEVMFTFMDKDGNYLPPLFRIAKFVVELYFTNKHSGPKVYKNPDDLLSEEARLEEMEKYLFGNETPVGDALAYGHGTTVPDMEKTKEDEVIH